MHGPEQGPPLFPENPSLHRQSVSLTLAEGDVVLVGHLSQDARPVVLLYVPSSQGKHEF